MYRILGEAMSVITKEEMKEMSVEELEKEIAERTPAHKKRTKHGNCSKNRNPKSKKLRIVRNNKCLKSKQKIETLKSEKFFESELIDCIKNRKKKSKKEIDLHLGQLGFECKETAYESLEKDARQIIRLDAYGFISIPHKKKLSDYFIRALDNPAIKPLKPKNYDLKKIPCWKYIEVFPNFKNFDILIKKALVKRNINPKFLSKMSFQDICYLYGDYAPISKEPVKKGKDGNIIKTQKLKKFKIFDGAKYKFGKLLANNYAKEYSKMLEILTNNKNEVKKYMMLAKEKGILHPKLEVHHNETVLNANCLENISKINDFSNFIVVTKPIHRFLHAAYDNSKIDAGDKKTIMYAFNKNDIIVFGRSKNRRVKRKDREPRGKVIKMKPNNTVFKQHIGQIRVSRG
jgi:hypothetical protein